jgi:hypothetical protein
MPVQTPMPELEKRADERERRRFMTAQATEAASFIAVLQIPCATHDASPGKPCWRLGIALVDSVVRESLGRSVTCGDPIKPPWSSGRRPRSSGSSSSSRSSRKVGGAGSGPSHELVPGLWALSPVRGMHSDGRDREAGLGAVRQTASAIVRVEDHLMTSLASAFQDQLPGEADESRNASQDHFKLSAVDNLYHARVTPLDHLSRGSAAFALVRAPKRVTGHKDSHKSGSFGAVSRLQERAIS